MIISKRKGKSERNWKDHSWLKSFLNVRFLKKYLNISISLWNISTDTYGGQHNNFLLINVHFLKKYYRKDVSPQWYQQNFIQKLELKERHSMPKKYIIMAQTCINWARQNITIKNPLYTKLELRERRSKHIYIMVHMKINCSWQKSTNGVVRG